MHIRETPGKLIADGKLGVDLFFKYVAQGTYEARSITGQRKYVGVEPEEIVSLDSLQCVPCRPPDLDIQMLKIFRIENFNDTPADVYGTLQPALKLASRFMVGKRLLSFWATLDVGDQEWDNGLKSGNSTSFSDRLPRRVNLTPSASAMLSRLRSSKPPSTEPQSPQSPEDNSTQTKIAGFVPVLEKKGQEKVAAQEEGGSGRDWEASGARECLRVVES